MSSKQNRGVYTWKKATPEDMVKYLYTEYTFLPWYRFLKSRRLKKQIKYWKERL